MVYPSHDMAGWTYPVKQTYFLDMHSEVSEETNGIRTEIIGLFCDAYRWTKY